MIRTGETPLRIDEDLLLSESVRWWELGNHPAESLTDAWRVTHHAAQAAAEIGKVFAIAREDDSHTSFEWCDGAGITDGFLAGELIEANVGPFRSAMRLFDMVLFLIRPSGDVIAELPLPGHSVDHATAWIVEQTLNAIDIEVRQASEPAKNLPAHPVADGADVPPPNQLAQIELIRLYANTNAMLTELERDLAACTQPRVWPGPFELSSLVELAQDQRGAPTKAVRLGLTPPDASAGGRWFAAPVAENVPSVGTPPRLPHGRWLDAAQGAPTTADPTAILELGALAGIEDRAEQQRIVGAFLAGAFNACAELLHA